MPRTSPTMEQLRRVFLLSLVALTGASAHAQTPVPAPPASPAPAPSTPAAPEYHGLVYFHGLPVPGATVTLTQGSHKLSTVSDTQGFYTFSGITNGPGALHIGMTGFAPDDESITVAADAPLGKTELKLLSLTEMRAELKPAAAPPVTVAVVASQPKRTGEAPKPVASAATSQPAAAPPSDDTAQRAADGLLINGSVNNAATSQYSLDRRFGNTASGHSLYNLSLNLRIENSAFDAKPYSIAGLNTTKPDTSEVTGGINVQGPLKIPHLLRNGPNVFLGYQRVRDHSAITEPGRVPTAPDGTGFLGERNGDFSRDLNAAGQPLVIVNPATGTPYNSKAVPVTPQAAALLALYPLPNVTGNAQYNYQLPLQTDTHIDSLNSNVNKTIGRNNQVSGTFAFNSVRSSNNNLFGFTDANRTLGMLANVNWAHTFNLHFRSNLGYQYSRQSNRTTPYWAYRDNISGHAGITGCTSQQVAPPPVSCNDQDAPYWGPPTLNFTSGISSLTDGNNSFLRNQTNGLTAVLHWNHSPHNVTAGVEFRRQQFNYLTEQNPRGTFSFNGSATAGSAYPLSGSDFADFLVGVPTSSQLAFGNPDKYLRGNSIAAYATDDWRVTPQLTVNAGMRWEYGSPASELKQRLVNLDVASNFAAIAPVLPSQPTGALTGQVFPQALLHSDFAGFEPRIGVSWRPLPASSLLIAAGYGVNFDTSVYQGIAALMSQQAPLSRSVRLQNSTACPLTLADGFHPCSTTTQQTFGIDPNFRVGYLHTWNLRVQRDLPGSLQMVATYLGNKGTRGVQEFLPNTNAPGAVVPCPLCPTGFLYITSTGDSNRESGQIQLRRRLKSGFTASVLYTYSKSLDDDSSLGGQGAATLGTATIAQDWRNLRGERSLSNFDQRHLLNATVQYTTGMGKGGGTLLSGWRGRVYKEWTVQTQLTAGSGLPETPLYNAAVISGYTSFVRPNVTGAPVRLDGSASAGSTGRFVNPAAYTAPTPGQWGNARRNSITGPDQLLLNAALLRTFRLPDKLELDAQLTAQNVLNHVTFTDWVTNINSTQFGLPASAQNMRTLQLSGRLRF